MHKSFIGAALVGLLISSGTTLGQSEYASEWTEGFHAGISRAMAKHQIRGCTQIRYKEHQNKAGTFLVECSEENGEEWTAYRVNVPELGVEGPLDH